MHPYTVRLSHVTALSSNNDLYWPGASNQRDTICGVQVEHDPSPPERAVEITLRDFHGLFVLPSVGQILWVGAE